MKRLDQNLLVNLEGCVWGRPGEEGEGFCVQIVFTVMAMMGLPRNNSTLSRDYHETQTGGSRAAWLIISTRAINSNKRTSTAIRQLPVGMEFVVVFGQGV